MTESRGLFPRLDDCKRAYKKGVNMWSAIGGLISGGINAIMQQESIHKADKRNDKALAVQQDIANKNLEFQKEQYQYQKDLNDLTMSREDNAVQRRVADLKAAGLNPVLAAGDSASSSSFRAGNAPQLDSSHYGAWAQRSIENARMGIDARMGLANMFLDMVRQKADISRSEAETALLWERANSMRELRPLNVENQTLANSFLKQSFDVRLEQKYADLSSTQKENLIRDKKALLLDKQIDFEDVRYLNEYADYLLKGRHMDKLDKELLVMDSLLKARDMEYQINDWNLRYFKDRGLPTTYRDPVQVKIYNELMKQLDNLFKGDGSSGRPFDPTDPNSKFPLFPRYDVDNVPFPVSDELRREIKAEEYNYKQRKSEKSRGSSGHGASREF